MFCRSVMWYHTGIKIIQDTGLFSYMSEQDNPVEAEDNEPVKKLATKFTTTLIRRVFIQIPSTILAIMIGAFAGGFIGLTFGPLAPLFALAGAIFIGVPVAVWEYKIKDKGGSSWDVE